MDDWRDRITAICGGDTIADMHRWLDRKEWSWIMSTISTVTEYGMFGWADLSAAVCWPTTPKSRTQSHDWSYDQWTDWVHHDSGDPTIILAMAVIKAVDMTAPKQDTTHG